MTEFKTRALEIHSQHAWNYNWIMKALRFMKAHHLNTLVLHRNDFIDLIVYPGKYFGASREKYNTIFERYQEIFRVLYKYTPTRRSGPYQRRAFLKRVIEMARREGIEVFIENKELYFPEIILEFYPDLVKDGKICASDPFWWEFTRIKYQEFFEEFPEISGIITAPATGESKVSITSNRCTCERCRNTTRQDWFRNLAMAMYEPLQAAGKKLVIRDFVFDAKAHHDIAAAMEQLPQDIAFALKNTPHDFYPTFPDNPRIGKVGEHEQWIEFDSMGQYFGWGIGPAIMVDDYRRRMKLAKENGAAGVIVRTDWESLDGHTSFDTLNEINLYAFSALSNNLQADGTAIYQEWLEDSKLLAPDLTEEQKREAALWAEAVLSQAWDVIKRTPYVNDCVFSDSSQLPVSLEHALWLSEEKNSLKDWDPSKANALSTDEHNVQLIMDEKDEALKLVRHLLSQVREGHGALTAEAHCYLIECFEVFEKYVQAFRIVVHTIILTKYRQERSAGNPTSFGADAEKLLQEKMGELAALAGEFQNMFETTDFNHRVYTLLDADRLLALHSDLSKKLQQTTWAEKK
ncbi:hypothetical protein [Paenibacillus thalictri]|uniref:DUF4838 domain-containing protein n=1 Tax=Paenibacillus thalictri TaxID=2527873 RepID=A0A4Q9DX41_9BACL|nr:hypothetical protein [Paenibacillus thalictri]TBL80600.1 hypothetical protein EYB31_05055 [Paenibacillus thalictri]